MDGILTIYIATAIFGVGVTLVDMFGILGSHSDDDMDGGDHSGDDMDTGDHSADDSDGDFDSDNTDGDDIDSDVGGDIHGDHTDDSSDDHGDDIEDGSDDHSHNEGSIVAHDNIRHKKNPVLRLLTILRTLVYFSFGFGPVGWIVYSTDQNSLTSLFFSIPSGIVFAIVGRLLKKLQTQELDSQVKDEELLMEKAEVLVTISNGELGKVRVNLDNTYIERYAKAKIKNEVYSVGTEVRVVDITDQYVIVSGDE